MKRSILAGAALLPLAPIIAAMAEERMSFELVTKLREIVRAAMDEEAVDKSIDKSSPNPETEHGEAQDLEKKAPVTEEIEAEDSELAEEGKEIKTIRFEGALTATDEVEVPVSSKAKEDEDKQQKDAAVDGEEEKAPSVGEKIPPEHKLKALHFKRGDPMVTDQVSEQENEVKPAAAEELISVEMGNTPIVLPRAWQSSTASCGEASRAIDGVTDGQWNSGSVTHTSRQNDPWWMLDLVAMTSINTIKVYNRLDYAPNRIDGAVVEIMEAEDGDPLASRTIEYDQGNPASYEFDFGGAPARYVRIKIPGSRKTLSLAEVEVYGSAVHPQDWPPYCVTVPNSDDGSGQFCYKGGGCCKDSQGRDYDYVAVSECAAYTFTGPSACASFCANLATTAEAPALRGFNYYTSGSCTCLFENIADENWAEDACEHSHITHGRSGTGPIDRAEGADSIYSGCMRSGCFASI